MLNAVEAHALTPEAVEAVIHLSERDEVAERQAALAKEAKNVDQRIARLTQVVETGAGDVQSLVAKLRELEARKRSIVDEVRALRPVPRLPVAIIESRLAEWRRLLRSSVTQGRSVLQRILRGRLTFTPWTNPVTGEIGYEFEGPTRFDKLFTGLAFERPKGSDPAPWGWEDIGPEDAPDGDYGRLLDRAYVKGGTSPTGFEPVFWP